MGCPLDEPRTLVGWGGFKGAPRDGVVELGYAVAPAWTGETWDSVKEGRAGAVEVAVVRPGKLSNVSS